MSIGRKIVFVIALMVFVGSAGAILIHYTQRAHDQNAFDNLKDVPKAEEGIWTENGYVIAKYANLYRQNPDIIGWLKIDGTKIDYPVMQTKDSPKDYYLRRNFKKESSISGTPFMDASSDIFKPTYNWLIYGHNMSTGTMFHDLLKYEEKEFYKEHKTFRFDTIYKGGQATYEVVAAFKSQIYPDDKKIFKYVDYAEITTEQELEEYVNGIKDLSLYKTGVSVEAGDQLVTLSTCSYHVPDKLGRFAVVGKRIDQ